MESAVLSPTSADRMLTLANDIIRLGKATGAVVLPSSCCLAFQPGPCYRILAQNYHVEEKLRNELVKLPPRKVRYRVVPDQHDFGNSDNAKLYGIVKKEEDWQVPTPSLVKRVPLSAQQKNNLPTIETTRCIFNLVEFDDKKIWDELWDLCNGPDNEWRYPVVVSVFPVGKAPSTRGGQEVWLNQTDDPGGFSLITYTLKDVDWRDTSVSFSKTKAFVNDNLVGFIKT